MRVLKTLVPALCFFILVGFTAQAQDESKKSDDVYFIVEDMPEYPGGDEQLRDDIAAEVKYPEEAKKNGIQGKVYITFVVSKVGKIKNTKIARGVDPLLDKEALRVMNALNKIWKPGKQRGEAVNIAYTVPINFALDNKKETKEEKAQTNKNGDVYFIVEDMPEFPGGDKALREYIGNTVTYPEIAQKNGIQGKVYVLFIVDVDGSVIDASIARGVDPSLDKEALRVVRGLPKWKPGKQKGKPVKVSYTVPINFSLGNEKETKAEKAQTNKNGDVFFIVEDMPEFPGGDKALREYIGNTVTYPEIAQKNGIQGKVYVSFIVDIDGSVTDASIARGVDPSLDKEALRVVRGLPKWKPGKQKGKAVKVQYTVPINFALS